MTEPAKHTVEQTLRIHARPETVWRYWTDPERLCEWWGAVAEVDPRVGGVCRVEMGGGPTMVGEYVELVPHERMAFTFGWEPTEGAPDVAPGSTLVEVTLVPDAGDTVLILRHTGLPAALAADHDVGWRRFLPLLVAAVEAQAPPGVTTPDS